MGSKTGWILALALIIVVVGVMYFVILDPPPSLPRETNAPGFLKLKKFPVSIEEIVGYVPSEPGNAGVDYHKAAELWILHGEAIDSTADVATYDALTASADPYSDPAMKACRKIADHVIAGSKKQDMKYTFTFTPKKLKIGYHYEYPEHLFKVAVAVHQLHMVHRDRKEFAEAEKLLQHMFVMGWHIYNEHAVPDMCMTGIEIQMSGIQRLQQLYDRWRDAPHRQRAQACKRYENTLRTVSSIYRRKRKILWDNIPAMDPVTHEPLMAPGDVFNIARNDEDRAWRVQAHIALGPLKFRVSSRGDSKMTRKLIARGKMSDDPFICAAAKAADKFSKDDFRHMGQSFGEGEDDY